MRDFQQREETATTKREAEDLKKKAKMEMKDANAERLLGKTINTNYKTMRGKPVLDEAAIDVLELERSLDPDYDDISIVTPVAKKRKRESSDDTGSSLKPSIEDVLEKLVNKMGGESTQLEEVKVRQQELEFKLAQEHNAERERAFQREERTRQQERLERRDAEEAMRRQSDQQFQLKLLEMLSNIVNKDK